MDVYCPVRPGGTGGLMRYCVGSSCVFSNGKGGCLLADTLSNYIEEKEREKEKLRMDSNLGYSLKGKNYVIDSGESK